MLDNHDYHKAVDATVDRIRATVPSDLVEKFEAASHFSRSDFISCTPARCGEVCAVDGSNVLLMESGSMALVLFRAAQATFLENERSRRSLSPLSFAFIGPGTENHDFTELYRECFGQDPGTSLMNDDRSKAAGVLRDTVEYWVTEQMANDLSQGALLLRDGPLRVSHASHEPVLARVELTCSRRGIDLAGVSKRTSATWGEGHPLLPAVTGLAKTLGVQAPWWVRIEQGVLDHTQFPRWQHGLMYVACLHPRAAPIKIELPEDTEPGRVMDRLAACSNDGRIPGYPYPLFDAHRTVTLTEEVVAQIRSDLMRRISGSGIERQTYDILFGDYHDEFARY